MKKLFIFSLLSLIVFFSALLIHTQAAQQIKLIKQSYTVSCVHNTYIEVQSNEYKDEYINLYYTDQIHKQSFNVNDKVVAYFQPNKHSFQIVDFKKVQSKLDSQTYTVNKIDSGIIYCTSSNNIKSQLSIDYTKGITLNLGDKIKVYYPHVDNGFGEITKVEKVN